MNPPGVAVELKKKHDRRPHQSPHDTRSPSPRRESTLQRGARTRKKLSDRIHMDMPGHAHAVRCMVHGYMRSTCDRYPCTALSSPFTQLMRDASALVSALSSTRETALAPVVPVRLRTLRSTDEAVTVDDTYTVGQFTSEYGIGEGRGPAGRRFVRGARRGAWPVPAAACATLGRTPRPPLREMDINVASGTVGKGRCDHHVLGARK